MVRHACSHAAAPRGPSPLKNMSRFYTWIDRFIQRETELSGDDGATHARAFLFILIAVYVNEGICNAIKLRQVWIHANTIEVTLVPALALVAAFTPYVRTACALLACTVLFRIVTMFPHGANHAYLLFFVFGLHALCDYRKPDQREWLLGTLKLIFLIVFFYTGLQKLLYGTYAEGEFFAVRIATTESFRTFFALFLPAEEIQRLASYSMVEGAGPFHLQSTIGLIVSRAAYTSEMVLPLLFLNRRTRALAVIGSVVLMILVECAAREFSFGMFFINFTLLFVSGALHWRLRWVFVLGAAIMFVLRVLQALEMIPAVHFG